MNGLQYRGVCDVAGKAVAAFDVLVTSNPLAEFTG